MPTMNCKNPKEKFKIMCITERIFLNQGLTMHPIAVYIGLFFTFTEN